MGTQQPLAGNSRALIDPDWTARSLLWLSVLAVAVGALQFAFAPASIRHPVVAAIGLGLLTLGTLAVRTAQVLRSPAARQHSIDVALLVICITLLASATGGAHSALLPLYAIALAGSAVAFGRWWLVVLLGCVIAALSLALGALTSSIDLHDTEALARLFFPLLPAIAVALVLAALIERMHTAVQRISDLTSTDALTGLLNLHTFEDILQQEHRKAERFGRSYTLLLIDVENLAQVNELLGHEAGSQVLAAVAGAITRSIRTSDVAARFGGDEFVVLLGEADAAMGAAVGQRIRNNVYAGTVSVANRLVRANVNVGAANFPDDRRYPKELMMLAGQRMQQDRELRRSPAA